jgi:hypothetical protein
MKPLFSITIVLNFVIIHCLTVAFERNSKSLYTLGLLLINTILKMLTVQLFWSICLKEQPKSMKNISHGRLHANTSTCCALQSEAAEAGTNWLIRNHSAHLVTPATVGSRSLYAGIALTVRHTFWWLPQPLALTAYQSGSIRRLQLVVMPTLIFSFQVLPPKENMNTVKKLFVMKTTKVCLHNSS